MIELNLDLCVDIKTIETTLEKSIKNFYKEFSKTDDFNINSKQNKKPKDHADFSLKLYFNTDGLLFSLCCYDRYSYINRKYNNISFKDDKQHINTTKIKNMLKNFIDEFFVDIILKRPDFLKTLKITKTHILHYDSIESDIILQSDEEFCLFTKNKQKYSEYGQLTSYVCKIYFAINYKD